MLITACNQYCLAAGATQGNIAYTQNVTCKLTDRLQLKYVDKKIKKHFDI